MEPVNPSKGKYTATDVTFHGRYLRPTQKFENSLKYGPNGSVISGRVYGEPRFVIDPKTNAVYIAHQFSPDVTEKFLDGTLAVPEGVSVYIDEVAQARIEAKEKGRLKDLTRFWRKRD